MSLVFWTTYTTTSRGVRLKTVLCEKCGGHYYYEMIRAAKGKGSALYNIDMDGAADRSAFAAKRKVYESLVREDDGVPCPGCGHLQSTMPIDRDGMPPALVWVSRIQADGSDCGYLATAKPKPAPLSSNGVVVFQVPRVTLPAACCNCGERANEPLRIPFQIGESAANLGVNCCDDCRGQLRSRAFTLAGIGWLIAAALGALVWVLAPSDSLTGEKLAGVIPTFLGVGFLSTFVLPALFASPYSFSMLDTRRLIIRMRFKNPKYATLAAASVVEANNAGQLFANESQG